MKNINVKNKYGHLWDTKTGNRVILKENKVVLINSKFD